MDDRVIRVKMSPKDEQWLKDFASLKDDCLMTCAEPAVLEWASGLRWDEIERSLEQLDDFSRLVLGKHLPTHLR